MLYRSGALFVGAMLATSLLSVPAAANLVQNGGFESVSGRTDNFEFGTTANAGAGAGKLENWASTGGYNLSFDSSTANSSNATGSYSYTGNEYLWASTASPNGGGRFVALDGDPAFSSAMTQTISGLTVGGVYTLTFDWGAAQLHSRIGDTTEQLRVTFGDQVFSTAVLPNVSSGFTGWNSVSTTFTATSASQLLSFLSVGTPSGLPPVALLDNVSLTAAVPEPASWAMMIVGFGVVGAALRRTRARQSVVFA